MTLSFKQIFAPIFCVTLLYTFVYLLIRVQRDATDKYIEPLSLDLINKLGYLIVFMMMARIITEHLKFNEQNRVSKRRSEKRKN